MAWPEAGMTCCVSMTLRQKDEGRLERKRKMLLDGSTLIRSWWRMISEKRRRHHCIGVPSSRKAVHAMS